MPQLDSPLFKSPMSIRERFKIVIDSERSCDMMKNLHVTRAKATLIRKEREKTPRDRWVLGVFV